MSVAYRDVELLEGRPEAGHRIRWREGSDEYRGVVQETRRLGSGPVEMMVRPTRSKNLPLAAIRVRP